MFTFDQHCVRFQLGFSSRRLQGFAYPKIVPSINQLSSVRARIMAPTKETTVAGVHAATDIGILKDDPKTCIK